jgi:hypothetical protein
MPAHSITCAIVLMILVFIMHVCSVGSRQPLAVLVSTQWLRNILITLGAVFLRLDPLVLSVGPAILIIQRFMGNAAARGTDVDNPGHQVRADGTSIEHLI